MDHRKRLIPVVILVVLLLGGYFLSSTGRLSFGGAADDAGSVSGYIEGDEVTIATEVGGRIQTIAVDEGDRVAAGQAIVQLDRSLLDAQIAQAQAAVETANSQLTQLKNGARASDISGARAALVAAQQNYDKVKAGPTAPDLAAAQAAVKAAQENYDKVRAGPTADQLAQLKAQAANAQAAVDQAQSAYDKIGGLSNPNIGMMPQSLALQQATNAYRAALGAYQDATSHPTAADLAAAQAQIDQAQAALARLTPDAAQLTAAQSQVDQAQTALDRLTPTADSITVAENQVKQARAALSVLQVQAGKMVVTSPVDGIVTRRAAHPGEVAAPNATLLSIANLDTVKLTIYVPETQIGETHIGDEVGVQVDSFPGKVFKGKVTFISSEAEFTPRNVQTKAERVNTVFAVKVQIPNPTFDLKPGMPADAVLK